MPSAVDHRGSRISRHGRRWRFKWGGTWRSFPTLDLAKRAVATLVEARSAQRAQDAQIEYFHGIGLGHVSVAELCNNWLSWKLSATNTDEPIRPRTAKDYRRCIDSYITPLIGSRDAASITTSAIKAELIRPCSSRWGARESRSVLRQAFRWAIEEGTVARRDNPAVDIKITRRNAVDGRTRNRDNIRAVTDDEIPSGTEIEKMLAWCLETGHAAWWRWIFVTTWLGTRPSETSALQRSDLRPTLAVVHVRRAVPTWGSDDWMLKTEDSIRTLPVAPEFFAELLPGLPDGDWLFPGSGRVHRNRPCWGETHPAHMIRVVRRKLGLSETYHPYSLRHYRATQLILAGKTELQVAKFLGTSVEMLQKVYANHLNRDAQRDIGSTPPF